MTDNNTQLFSDEGIDVNRDRHADHFDALQRAVQHERFPEAQIDRFEVGFQASGEVTVRWRQLGAEEWDGFVMPPVGEEGQ